MFNLKNQVAVITGASSSLGMQMAKLLYDPKRWTGLTTLSSVQYDMELFDNNNKSIAKNIIYTYNKNKGEYNFMELSEKVKQSYLDFCGIHQRPNDEDYEVKIAVAYNPDTNTVTVTENGISYVEHADSTTGEEKYYFLDNQYIFERPDSTTISYTVDKNGFYRQGSGPVGGEYSSYGPGDTSLDYYFNKESNRTITTASYELPVGFRFENGLPSEMKKIEPQKTDVRIR